MRGALLSIIAAGLALGCVLAAQAAERPYARAEAAVAQVGENRFGTATSQRKGEDTTSAQVSEREVSVEKGEVFTRADSGARGFAKARAVSVSMIGGRVTAGGVRRVARFDDELNRSGGVYDLRIDGVDYGDIFEPRTLELPGGGLVIVNTGNTGIRVLIGEYDVRAAVAAVRVVGSSEPTPTPTATATPRATPTGVPTAFPPSTAAPPVSNSTVPPVKKAPSVEQRLTGGGYAFPVYGTRVRVADTFGADRPKPIRIHQGVDIFAPFGAPVVAVRDGRLSHVGTLPISGNRLWLHTDNGDAFFYAHMSAFSEAARNGARVKAGAVLGFVGNTGDAEPTPPHLHFEVHPGGMKKDAVDPYPIVTAWQRRDDVPPGAWLQELGPDATERPGTLVTVRDFIAE